MAEAIKLLQVAKDKGFRERISLPVVKQAMVILDDVSPDAADLVLAKLITTEGVASYADRFSIALVTISGVADALDAAGYDHFAATDSAIENSINNIFPTIAKGYI